MPIKRITSYIKNWRHQLLKYVIVGGSGVVLDIATLVFFTEVLLFSAVTGVILNQFIVLIYNFSLNKYWTFKNREIPHKQLVRYGILACGNYGFSVLTMYLFHDILGWSYLLVRIGTIAVMVSWNFLLYKYWVYQVSPVDERVHNSGVFGDDGENSEKID